MAEIDIGAVCPLHRGAWTLSVAYNFLDWVTHGGSSYMCVNSNGAPAGTSLSNTTYWAQLAKNSSVMPGAVVPFYNVSFLERYPIFWGQSEADTGWLICDGGSDLNGGEVPNLSDRFILGTTDVSAAKETGGSNTTGNTTVGGTISNVATGGATSYTTLALSQIPSHGHSFNQYAGGDGGPTSPGSWGSRQYTKWSTDAAGGSGSHAHSLSGTEHSHTFTGSSHNHSATPPYYKLVYCVKLPE